MPRLLTRQLCWDSLWLKAKYPIKIGILGANHKTLHHRSRATVAHHPHLVRVLIVNTTARHHRPSSVRRKPSRVWITAWAAIWSTTIIASRQPRSQESVISVSRRRRIQTRAWWDRRTTVETYLLLSIPEVAKRITMGELRAGEQRRALRN